MRAIRSIPSSTPPDSDRPAIGTDRAQAARASTAGHKPGTGAGGEGSGRRRARERVRARHGRAWAPDTWWERAKCGGTTDQSLGSGGRRRCLCVVLERDPVGREFSRSRRSPGSGAVAPGQPLDGQVVGILNRVGDQPLGDTGARPERDPVAFVEVAARCDRGVGAFLRAGVFRFALDRVDLFFRVSPASLTGPPACRCRRCAGRHAARPWTAAGQDGLRPSPLDPRGAPLPGSPGPPGRFAGTCAAVHRRPCRPARTLGTGAYERDCGVGRDLGLDVVYHFTLSGDAAPTC
jgi:hypothetical protein